MTEYNVLRVVTGYQCNQHCPFCYQHRRDGGFLRIMRLEEVLSNRPTFTPEFVTLMGGEPTLYPELLTLVTLLRGRYPRAWFSITTNGSAPVELYMALDACGMNNITFSLQTLDPNQFSTLTGQHKILLEDYIAKILHVRARARASVRINAYIIPENAEAMYRFCKQHDLKLTFCEDLLSRQVADSQRLNLSGGVHEICENDLRRIYWDKDGFEFWNYKHIDVFKYYSFIVLPDGSVTDDFADILAQRGAII